MSLEFQPDDQTFSSTIQAINKIVEEAVLEAGEDGLSVTAADPSMVAMVDTFIPAERFETFEINGLESAGLEDKSFNELRSMASNHGYEGNNPSKDELVEYLADREGHSQQIGVNFQNLASVLKKMSDSFTVHLDEEEHHLIIEDDQTRFSLPVLNLQKDIPSTDDLDFSFKAEVETKELDNGLDRVGLFSSSTTFQLADTFTLQSQGDSTETEVQIDSEVVENPEEVEEAIFSLDYLNKMVKGMKKLPGDDIEVNTGNDFPLKLMKEDEDYNFSYILAPRIEE